LVEVPVVMTSRMQPVGPKLLSGERVGRRYGVSGSAS
jgi:hypothetical protein